MSNRISRRSLLAIGMAGLARPALGELRGGSFRVGLLSGGAPPEPWLAAFLKKLEELGYVEGKNLRFELRAAAGQFDRLPALAAELIALPADVIVTTTTPSLMVLYKAHCPIPVVFNSGADPMTLGVAESVAHPGGNYTGIVNGAGDISSKRLQLLRDLLPGAARVVCFINPANTPELFAQFKDKIVAEAGRLGFQLLTAEVASADDLPQAFARAAEQKADALLGIPDPLLFSSRQKIITLAREHRLPAIYNFRIEAMDGGLIAYGADVEAEWRTLAIYVDKILRGEKPGDLPIEQETKLALVINLKTAKELGLEVPPLLLAQADDVIE